MHDDYLFLPRIFYKTSFKQNAIAGNLLQYLFSDREISLCLHFVIFIFLKYRSISSGRNARLLVPLYHSFTSPSDFRPSRTSKLNYLGNTRSSPHVYAALRRHLPTVSPQSNGLVQTCLTPGTDAASKSGKADYLKCVLMSR